MSEPTCAVWYWSHGSPNVQIFDDEAAAARYAHDLYDYDDGAPEGVQYPDGSFVECDSWPAYKDEIERRWRDAYAAVERERSQPRSARREIRPPFDYDGGVIVPASAPGWLGAEVASR